MDLFVKSGVFNIDGFSIFTLSLFRCNFVIVQYFTIRLFRMENMAKPHGITKNFKFLRKNHEMEFFG